MKCFQIFILILAFTSTSGWAEEANENSEYTGTSFQAVWTQILSDPYSDLPQYEVTLRSFFDGLRNYLLDDAHRTLSNENDLLPSFQKLIRQNGVCLAGKWSIDVNNPYSGYFKSGSEGLIIARASVGLTETTRGHYRSFGIAGKLYPTLDRSKVKKTANFFAIDDNGGTLLPHFTDATLTNEPGTSINVSSLSEGAILAAVKIAQSMSDSHSGIRQLYPVSKLGVEENGIILAPQHIALKQLGGTKIEESDFRNELDVSRYPGGLIYGIFVDDKNKRDWMRIGQIKFTESVSSFSCDFRLHFAHPRYQR